MTIPAYQRWGLWSFKSFDVKILKRAIISFIVCVSFFISLSCRDKKGEEVEVNYPPETREIGIYGPYEALSQFHCSQDGENWGFIAEGEKVWYCVVNNRVWGPYEKMWVQEIEDYITGVFTMNDDGFWVFTYYDGGLYYLILDGEKSGPYKHISEVILSDEGKSHIIMGDYEFGNSIYPDDLASQFDYIDEIVLSKDGSSTGYCAYSNDKIYVVIDGKRHGPYDNATGLLSSSDGEVWCYRIESEEGEYFIVFGGEEYGPYKDVRWMDITPDRRNWIASVEGEDGWSAVVSGREYGPYDEVIYVTISDDSDEWGYTIKRDDKYYAVVSGIEYGPYNDIWSVSISPDGASSFIRARKNDGMYAIIDGEQKGPYKAIFSSMFDEDDGVWYYSVYTDDGYFVSSNGKKWGPFDRDVYFFGRDGEYGFFYIEELEDGKFGLCRICME